MTQRTVMLPDKSGVMHRFILKRVKTLGRYSLLKRADLITKVWYRHTLIERYLKRDDTERAIHRLNFKHNMREAYNADPCRGI